MDNWAVAAVSGFTRSLGLTSTAAAARSRPGNNALERPGDGWPRAHARWRAVPATVAVSAAALGREK